MVTEALQEPDPNAAAEKWRARIAGQSAPGVVGHGSLCALVADGVVRLFCDRGSSRARFRRIDGPSPQDSAGTEGEPDDAGEGRLGKTVVLRSEERRVGKECR